MPPAFSTFLVQQVAAVLGTARLAQLHDQTVLDSHHRLYVEQRAHGAGRSRQTTAAHQVLQRLEQADNHHTVAHGLDSRRDRAAPWPSSTRRRACLDQHALTQGNVIAINHIRRRPAPRQVRYGRSDWSPKVWHPR